jgi:hypothetical protein
MAKTDNPPVEYVPPPYQNQNAIADALKDLTAAISARRDVPQPSKEATRAAAQYGEIKGALRTHSGCRKVDTAGQPQVQAVQTTGE